MLSGRAPGIDLSDQGRDQAKALGERLAGLPVAVVYASPIERTTQTAEAVAQHHGLTVQPLPGVIEADYGEWTGGKLVGPGQDRSLEDGAAGAVARAVPRRRVAGRDADRAWSRALEAVVARPPGRAGGRRVARRPDQGRDRALHRGPPRPLPADRGVAGVGHGVRAVGPRRSHAQVQRHRLSRRAAPAAPRRRRHQPTPRPETDQHARSRRRGGHRGAEHERRDHRARRRRRPRCRCGRASPASAPSTSRRARSRRQLTVLVEKEQVALLAAEAVAFLDQIADDYPELPFDIPSTQSMLREPTVPLFRARLIGLGFDPERELVLIELRERAAEDDDDASEVVEVAEDDDGLRRPHLRHPRPGARHGGSRGRGRRRGAPALPALRAADGSRRAPLSSLELTPEELRAALEGRRARGRRPHAVLVERDLPRRGEGRRRGAGRDLQAPAR